MFNLSFTLEELALIVHALERLEQDESCKAQPAAEQAADLLARWDVLVVSEEEE